MDGKNAPQQIAVQVDLVKRRGDAEEHQVHKRQQAESRIGRVRDRERKARDNYGRSDAPLSADVLENVAAEQDFL